ncbi:MAG: RidA family protein [Nitrospirae bacterium]|nr:RidA family protein [Nitrospirota bacterium]MBI5695539.1 RidA family protein [Nitrospirota bacterium]
MPREIITTNRAPAAVGAYSQAVRVGDFVFVSGQIPLNPETGEVVFADITEQTERILVNIRNILQEAGMGLEDVVKTTVFLELMDDLSRVNEVYGRFFGPNPPARAAVEVARLPKDVAIEIEAVAYKSRG